MSSLYDDLSEKLKKDPRLTKRGGARYDLSLLLFNARDSLRELWDAAEREVTEAKREGYPPSELLEAAVEKLRPIFGEVIEIRLARLLKLGRTRYGQCPARAGCVRAKRG